MWYHSRHRFAFSKSNVFVVKVNGFGKSVFAKLVNIDGFIIHITHGSLFSVTKYILVGHN